MQKPKSVIVTDSRLLSNQILIPKLRGASEILYKQWPATGASRDMIQFSCPSPTETIEIDRHIQLLCPVRLTFSMEDVPASTYLLEPNLCNIRSYPLQKAMSHMEMTINNHTMRFSVGSLLSALENFNTTTNLKNLEYSTTATYGTCQAQAFDDLPQGSRSGLANYADSICGIAPQTFPFTVVSQTTPVGPGTGTATAVLDFVSVESIFLSPLYWGSSNDNLEAMVGVRTLDMSFHFQPNAGMRMFAIDDNGTFPLGSGAITVTEQYEFTASDNFSYPELQPKLLMQYIQPQDVYPRDHKQILPYFDLETYTTNHTSAIAPQASEVVSSTEISLPRMPTKIFIFARRQDEALRADPFHPDCFNAITDLKVTWNTRTCLSGAHQTQLYNISVKNGLQMDYTSFSGLGINRNASAPTFGTVGDATQFSGTGSLICLDPLDLGISLDMSQNPEHQIALQVDATVKNVAADSYVPALYVVTLLDGMMTIQDGVVSSRIGITSTKLEKPIEGKDENVSFNKKGFMTNHAISLKHLFRKRK